MAKTKKEVEEVEKPKVALEKVVVTAKQIGKNLNIIIGNEKFTRIGSKEELQVVKDVIEAYNNKSTKKNLEGLMAAVKPVTVANEKEEQKVKADIKATKNKIKEKAPEEAKKARKTVVADVIKEIDEKMMDDNELKDLEAAIARQKAKREPTPQKATSAPRGREW